MKVEQTEGLRATDLDAEEQRFFKAFQGAPKLVALSRSF